jgi:hypothetical protein
MSDPIPGCDPNEAYEVVPLDPIRKGSRSTGLVGMSVQRHRGQDRGRSRSAEPRYASDPDYRASLITKKL